MATIHQQLVRLEGQYSRTMSAQLSREYSRLGNIANRIIKRADKNNSNPLPELYDLMYTHESKIGEIARIHSQRFLNAVADNMAPRTNSDREFISRIKARAKEISETSSKLRVSQASTRTQEWLAKSSDMDLEEAIDFIIDRFNGDIMERRVRIISNDILQTTGNELINSIGEIADAQDNKVTYKQWLTQGDSKVRIAHREAKGQTVLIDDSFSVDGESLSYPGDPSGSARNTINCRCFMKIIRRKEKSQ